MNLRQKYRFYNILQVWYDDYFPELCPYIYLFCVFNAYSAIHYVASSSNRGAWDTLLMKYNIIDDK